MRKETAKELQYLITSFVYGDDADIDFRLLFDVFIQMERCPIEKFDEACNEFFQYIVSVKDLFTFQTELDKKNIFK